MSRAKGLFITGTDTGVGKTRVTAILAVALQQQGFRIGIMKPVETGCLVEENRRGRGGRGPCADPGGPSTPLPIIADGPPSYEGNGWEASGMKETRRGREGGEEGRGPCADPGGPSTPMLAQDALFLRQISGCMAPLEIITPYMFREPLAPAIAAQHEGQEIDLNHIIYCYEMLAAEHDIVLVEGAGGLLVPLTKQQNFLDLATRLALPILVVARNILGTINHTALTVIVASQRCHVSGIILNTVTEEAQDASQASNAEALQIWGGAPLLGVLSYMLEVTPESLLKQSESINLPAILSSGS